MKRILPLIMALMIICSLSVPAFAAVPAIDYNGTTLPDIGELDVDHHSMPYVVVMGQTNSNPYPQVWFTSEPFAWYASGVAWRITDANYMSFTYENGAWKTLYSYVGTSTGTSKFTTDSFLWANYDFVQNGTVVFEGADYSFLVCDGSSCPASDADKDGICDDCGAMLRLIANNTFEVIVQHSETMTIKYLYEETVAGTTFNALYSDNRITVTFDNRVGHTQYRLVDGEWIEHSPYSLIYDSHAINFASGSSVLSSDWNIYDENGDLFFQNPLWMEMDLVTQGEMEALKADLAGTMKILTVCGVGCLALLTVLVLFGKRWLLSLS